MKTGKAVIGTSIFRQGDILLVQVARLPEQRTARNSRIVAEGEQTGHAHVFGAATTVLYDAPNASEAARKLLAEVGLTVEVDEAQRPIFVEVNAPDALVHQEHAAHTLEPGAYVALRQVEWSDSCEPITVAD